MELKLRGESELFIAYGHHTSWNCTTLIHSEPGHELEVNVTDNSSLQYKLEACDGSNVYQIVVWPSAYGHREDYHCYPWFHFSPLKTTSSVLIRYLGRTYSTLNTRKYIRILKVKGKENHL